MPRRQDDHGSGRSADWRPHDTDPGIDPFDDSLRSTRPPSSRPAVPPPGRPARGASPARRPVPAQRRVDLRTVLLAGGGLLAVVATVLVFLTDDPDLLRVAVVAAAWAFVLATFVAGRRRSEQADAAGREAALRRTYEQELEREVAARREYELELENDLRRETEDAMRSELDALRAELSGVTELRREVARVAELREDVAGLSAMREDVAGLSAMREDLAELSALRDEVARVAALRDDVLSLTALRAELGQIGELRADLGRLRSEIVEQFSSEMLVERIVMRTQAGRLSSPEHGRLDAGASWRDGPPRELTGGWPAVRLDENAGTQQYERVRVERPAPPLPWEPASGPATAPPSPYVVPPAPQRPLSPPPVQPLPTSAWPLPEVPAEPAVPVRPVEPDPPSWSPPVTEAYGMSLPPRRSRHSADGEAADLFALPAEPPPSPLEWLGSRALVDPPAAPDVPATAERPRPTPRRRRDDGDLVPPSADDLLTTERPAAGRLTGAGYPFGPPAPPTPPVPNGTGGHDRLEEILAESGVQPATGNRRRRRYRDDDGSDDDVLSRVLRGG
jgi:hypothetical protein